MGGTIHCEQGYAQWLVLPCRCTRTKDGWPGQTRTRNQATLECSSASTLLLLRGAMYVSQFIINKISAIRVWTRGLPCSYACVFYYCFVHTVHVSNCFELRPKNSSNVCCVVDLVTRLTNTKMVVKSRDEEYGKHENGLGDSVQNRFGRCRLLTPVIFFCLC